MPPSIFCNSFPVSASHILNVLSRDDEMICLPSELKDAEYTADVCPSKVFRSLPPIPDSHILIVPSSEAETMRLPSGLIL